MAKAKKSRSGAKRSVARSKRVIEYNSFTFLLFLVFVLIASIFLVMRMLANY